MGNHSRDSNEKYLLLCFTGGMTDTEIWGWNQIKELEAKRGTLFVEVLDRNQLDEEHERLTQEGWLYRATGSGWLTKVSTYSKNVENG